MLYSELFTKRSRNKGFTVIELLIVIAIIAILGLISIGPMLRWRANSFIETAANNLMSDFERAKIEAVRYSRNVSIIFSADTTTYQCFIEANDNGVFEAGEQMLFERTAANSATNRVNAVITDGSNNRNGIIFTPRGFVRGSNLVTVVITGLNNHSTLTRTIIVNRIGNVSSTAF